MRTNKLFGIAVGMFAAVHALAGIPGELKVDAVKLEFVPYKMRIPLKFGAETSTHGCTARVCMKISDGAGNVGCGWGETPLSANWGWPSDSLTYGEREQRMKAFCEKLVGEWKMAKGGGHPLELGYAFTENQLKRMEKKEDVPTLAALICCSAFDLALHDAFGQMVKKSIWDTYTSEYLRHDLAWYFNEPAFAGKYPAEYLVKNPPAKIPVWHLVGGKDLIDAKEKTGKEPNDGYPVLLEDWIRRDGLFCLKVKLRGNDGAWDYKRMMDVGAISLRNGVKYLSADFNCMAKDPAYVNTLVDRLRVEAPAVYNMLLYVEQPFPYDLPANPIDAHSVSQRKPLFMDESAHDWRIVKLGQRLGWTGVALKVCKTLSGAVLSGCWARQHGMDLMVQDLTNPRMAIIPHVELAQHFGTIMGVECNAQQFYPDASAGEEPFHPGIYRRRDGVVDLSNIRGFGFGYNMGLTSPF